MKRGYWAVVVFALTMNLAFTGEPKRKPENLTMTLAWVADADNKQEYIFVINGVVAYKTVVGLKKYITGIPHGSTLTWAPGCSRTGKEPLLNSPKEMKEFKAYCKSCGIKLVIVPSG